VESIWSPNQLWYPWYPSLRMPITASACESIEWYPWYAWGSSFDLFAGGDIFPFLIRMSPMVPQQSVVGTSTPASFLLWNGRIQSRRSIRPEDFSQVGIVW